MTAKEVIEALSGMPQDQSVEVVWDGAARSSVDKIWASRDGRVLLSEAGAVVYYTDDRPESAPTEKQDNYWKA